MTRGWGRKHKKLLDNLKDRRGYCQLKEEALDCTMRRNRFGRGFVPVVWQSTDDDDDDVARHVSTSEGNIRSQYFYSNRMKWVLVVMLLTVLCLSFLCVLLLYLWSCSFLVLFSSCFLFLVLGFARCWGSRTYFIVLSCCFCVVALDLAAYSVRCSYSLLFLLCYGSSVSKIGNGAALVSCWFCLLWLYMWNSFMVFLHLPLFVT